MHFQLPFRRSFLFLPFSVLSRHRFFPLSFCSPSRGFAPFGFLFPGPVSSRRTFVLTDCILFSRRTRTWLYAAVITPPSFFSVRNIPFPSQMTPPFFSLFRGSFLSVRNFVLFSYPRLPPFYHESTMKEIPVFRQHLSFTRYPPLIALPFTVRDFPKHFERLTVVAPQKKISSPPRINLAAPGSQFQKTLHFPNFDLPPL